MRHLRFLAGNNYMLADKNGEMAVVEASPDRVRVRYPLENQSFIVATNHFVHDEMKEVEDTEKRDPDSMRRYSAISQALTENKLQVDAKLARRILSNHDGRLCSHVEYIQLGTLWFTIADLPL